MSKLTLEAAWSSRQVPRSSCITVSLLMLRKLGSILRFRFPWMSPQRQRSSAWMERRELPAQFTMDETDPNGPSQTASRMIHL